MSEFSVLGPLTARGPAGEVRLGGGVKLRVVLALLVLRAGQLVSRDALVDALWPDDPPPSARQTVESYVSRLRRALREAGLEDAAIESAPAGYRLALNGAGVDRDAFDALVAAGREAGDAGTAAARLGEALALWRGPALDGLAELPALRADAAALTQARLSAVEEWAQVQLDLGRVPEVLAVLRRETADHPRRERLDELLMLALYRSGAQADALEHYAAVRRDLVDELGLEPGPGLRELQQRILRQDPALESAPAAPPPEPRAAGRALAPPLGRSPPSRRWRAQASSGCSRAATTDRTCSPPSTARPPWSPSTPATRGRARRRRCPRPPRASPPAWGRAGPRRPTTGRCCGSAATAT